MNGDALQQLAALNRISRIALQDMALRPMLQRIVDALHDEFGREFIAFAGIDHARGEFVCDAVRAAIPSEVSVGYRRALGSGVVGHVAAHGVSMEPGVIELGPKQVLNFDVRLSLNANGVKESIEEVDGYVKFYNEKEEVFRIPVLAVVRKISGVMPESLLVNSTSKIDSEGSFVQLKLVNQSQQPGVSFPMNLIAQDERKKSLQWDEYRSRACDLQSVGYKIVGEKIYVGFKLYQQVTTWDLCELNMQIDSDGDGQADQEIVGVSGAGSLVFRLFLYG